MYENVLAELYDCPWAIREAKFDVIERAFWERVRSGPLPAAERQPATAAASDIPAVAGGVAVVPIRGTITKRPSIMASGGTSTERVARMLETALADAGVRSILLDIDSPGGQVFGVEELAAKVRAADAVKPVHAVADATAASAAYWLGSQARTLSVTPSGEVGSIGVLYRHVDQSAAMAKDGIAVTFVTAGKYKVEGNSYGPLTGEALAERQRNVTLIYDKFVAAVAAGRGVSVETVNETFGQGRMYFAAEAVGRGMADAVATKEQVMELMQADIRRTKRAAVAVAARAVVGGCL